MIEQIAKTAHAIHRAYCLEMGIPTQPKWEEVESDHKEVVYSSINKIMQGGIKTVEESHNNFIKSKYLKGWRYGAVYSIEDKLNPRMVDFSKLTIEQRIKERLFFECVNSFIVSNDQSLNSKPVDSIIQQVCEEYLQRGKVGLEKYGVTLDREDLTREQWIQHAKEEAMDLTLYLTKIQKLL